MCFRDAFTETTDVLSTEILDGLGGRCCCGIFAFWQSNNFSMDARGSYRSDCLLLRHTAFNGRDGSETSLFRSEEEEKEGMQKIEVFQVERR